MPLLREPHSTRQQVSSYPRVRLSWCDRDPVMPAWEGVQGESCAESLGMHIQYAMCILFLALGCAFSALD